MIQFPTDIQSILTRVENIQPKKYARSRNYIDGEVTYLSPYIARGVISTKMVVESLKEKGYELGEIEKYVQELAWRDFFQQNWISLGNGINEDIKHKQTPVEHYKIPKNLVEANTGIEAIDSAIREFYETGYLHNHVRMYIAAITCNMAKSYWKLPAQWMYYNLLDSDWGSNAASWQWVAGSNSNKKYIANQENINRYCHTKQTGTFLDLSYEALAEISTPSELAETIDLELKTPLPKAKSLEIDNSLPTLLYTYYNLDPNWHKDKNVNRILIFEPSVFDNYPVSQKCIDFALDLSKNIEEIQLFVGEFNELEKQISSQEIFYKEHPLNDHFKGNEESRDWMFNVTGYHKSFFSFWKKCKKQWKSNQQIDLFS